MENEIAVPTPSPTGAASVEWTSIKVYTLGVICLVLGIVLGALFHGPTRPLGVPGPSIASDQANSTNPVQMSSQAGAGRAPVPVAASDPVFDKVKSEPNNFELLAQAGNAAMTGGAPKLAVDYYGRALKVKDNLDVRTNLANAYFRSGNADQSLAELAEVLQADPKNDKALYNTGVVRLMAKHDAKGAIASWETFLKYHPDHPHKAQVQEMIKRVKQSGFKAQG